MCEICPKCGASRSDVSFKTKIDTPDDMAKFCVPCRRKVRRLKYQKTNGKEKHLEASRRHSNSAKGAAVKKKWRDENPEKYKAHGIVAYAIKQGRLVKQPCDVCGSKDVHAHHDDYLKPLNVRWLCSAHHSQWHRDNGEGKNA